MFNWIKSTSFTKKLKSDSSSDRSVCSNKLKTKLTISTSSVSNRDSVNHDLEDTFHTKKKFNTFNRSKRISRRIVSMFGRKTIASIDEEMKKNGSTASLLNERLYTSVDEEAAWLEERCSRRLVKKDFSMEGKGRLFRGKPLDDYAKRKLQISRDLEWDGVFASSSSLSSFVNESAFSASSLRREAGLRRKTRPRISLHEENSSVVVHRKMMSPCASSRRSSGVISKFEEETLGLDGNKSFTLSDSGIYVSGNSSDSNSFIDDQNRSTANISNELKDPKFACSFDCLACLAANGKSCEECALNYDESTNRQEDRASESNRGTCDSGRFVSAQRRNAVSCNPRIFSKRRWSIAENSIRSESTDELLNDDSLYCSNEIAECACSNYLSCESSNHLPCESLNSRVCPNDGDGCFVNRALDLSDEDTTDKSFNLFLMNPIERLEKIDELSGVPETRFFSRYSSRHSSNVK